jgi:cholesterol oxidase
VPLAVYFGDGPGVTAPDPFFDGEGPERTGCQLCGGCLVGCPYGAKNSLDLNYLHLAERHGAEIRPLHQVDAIIPLDGGGYEVRAKHPWKSARQPALRAQHVVLAGGVLGTLDLLLRCRDELGTLPNLSARLGERVRTNSEAVTGILEAEASDELMRGPSITSDFHPDATTHVTQNRYLGGGRLLRFQMGPMVDGTSAPRRALATLGQLVRHPGRQLRIVGARRFDDRYTALTVMQNEDSQLRITLRRGLFSPLKPSLKTGPMPGAKLPGFVPVANAVTRAYAESSGGRPLNSLVETLGGPPLTAHILGGAVMGATAETGVIDVQHEVHGHPGLYVADASAIPANLGVNPSLSITAFAERFAAAWPEAPKPADRDAARATVASAHATPLRQQRPWSPWALQRRFSTLPPGSPEQLVGMLRAEFIGPRWLTLPAPLTVSLLGMPGWWGKRFALQADGTVAGENLIEHGGRFTPSFAMTATVEPSKADGLPALVVRYAADAPWPWRGVTDELRPLDDDTFLGLTFGLPSPISGGSPFLLRREGP